MKLNMAYEGEEDLHSEYDTAESCAEDHLNCSPASASQDIQITSKRDPWQKVGKKDIDAARHYKLIEDGPVG